MFPQRIDKGKRNPHPSRPGSYASIEANGAATQSLDDTIPKNPVVPRVDYDASSGSVHHLGLSRKDSFRFPQARDEAHIEAVMRLRVPAVSALENHFWPMIVAQRLALDGLPVRRWRTLRSAGAVPLAGAPHQPVSLEREPTFS